VNSLSFFSSLHSIQRADQTLIAPSQAHSTLLFLFQATGDDSHCITPTATEDDVRLCLAEEHLGRAFLCQLLQAPDAVA